MGALETDDVTSWKTMHIKDFYLVAVENGLCVAVHGRVVNLVLCPHLAHHEALPEGEAVGEDGHEQHVAVGRV